MRQKFHGLASALLALGLLTQPVFAADPVKIVVGYQPYDTISYSAAVIRAKELWKKKRAKLWRNGSMRKLVLIILKLMKSTKIVKK